MHNLQLETLRRATLLILKANNRRHNNLSNSLLGNSKDNSNNRRKNPGAQEPFIVTLHVSVVNDRNTATSITLLHAPKFGSANFVSTKRFLASHLLRSSGNTRSRIALNRKSSKRRDAYLR